MRLRSNCCFACNGRGPLSKAGSSWPGTTDRLLHQQRYRDPGTAADAVIGAAGLHYWLASSRPRPKRLRLEPTCLGRAASRPGPAGWPQLQTRAPSAASHECPTRAQISQRRCHQGPGRLRLGSVEQDSSM